MTRCLIDADLRWVVCLQIEIPYQNRFDQQAEFNFLPHNVNENMMRWVALIKMTFYIYLILYIISDSAHELNPCIDLGAIVYRDLYALSLRMLSSSHLNRIHIFC